jgi:hypothetical protein
MRQQVAIAVDGVWQFQEVVGDDDRRSVALASPMDAMDEVVAQLSRVVMLAQDMSDEDQRRVRDFVHAASAMLLAIRLIKKHLSPL